IGYPKETVGYTFYLKSEGKVFVAKNGAFLGKEFLSRELSGRNIELDEKAEIIVELRVFDVEVPSVRDKWQKIAWLAPFIHTEVDVGLAIEDLVSPMIFCSSQVIKHLVF
ncbi:hypothetical protein ZWY2020_047047, partial [Hordeum vulgare]